MVHILILRLHHWTTAKSQLLEDTEYEELGIKTKAQFYPQIRLFIDKALPSCLEQLC